MALGDAYENDVLAGLSGFKAPPKPAAKTSAWSAPVRGLAAGGVESGGFLAEIAGAFGQALAGTDARPGGMFAPEAPDAAKARESMLKGLEFSNPAGDVFRQAAKDMRTDPRTASTADQVVFDFFRFAGKAVGYSLAGGPVVGAALTGGDEALTAADALKQQGVDLDTRTKAGALAGVAAAAGVALPVAGRTWAQTAGLVAAGGPGAFVGQQAATRWILQNGGYDAIADTYDPFDPAGLAVSALVPAGFGAWAMRGRSRPAPQVDKSTISPGDKPADLQGSPPEFTDTVPDVHVPRETVDAARVSLDMEAQRDASLAPDDDAALQRASEQLAAGERVDAADLAQDAIDRARERIPVGEATELDVQRIDALDAFAGRITEAIDEAMPWESLRPAKLDDGVRKRAPLADERLTDDATREQLQLMAAEAGWSMKGGQMIRSGIDEPGDGGMGGEVVGRTTWQAQGEWYAAMQRDRSTRLPNDKAGVQAAVQKAIDGEPMTPQERRAVRYMLEIAREDADPLSGVNLAREFEAARLDDTSDNRVDTALVARAAEIDEAAVERMAIEAGDDDAAFMASVERFLDANDARSATDAGSGRDQPAADGGARPAEAGGDARQGSAAAGRGDADTAASDPGAAAEAAAVETRLAEIEQQFPDLAVRLDGMDGAVPLRELMARVKQEAALDEADAPLYEIAAQCFLTQGG